MIPTSKALYIQIDMQYGFLAPESSLCIAGALETVPACRKGLDTARKLGIQVVHAVRKYAVDGSDVEPARYPIWLADGKPLSEAEPESLREHELLVAAAGELSVVKPSYSAFFRTDLEKFMKEFGLTTVVLAGTTTPNCIRSTCYDALSIGYNVIVLSDATSSRSPEVQQANLEDMACAGAQIISVDDFAQNGMDNVRDFYEVYFYLLVGNGCIFLRFIYYRAFSI